MNVFQVFARNVLEGNCTNRAEIGVVCVTCCHVAIYGIFPGEWQDLPVFRCRELRRQIERIEVLRR